MIGFDPYAVGNIPEATSAVLGLITDFLRQQWSIFPFGQSLDSGGIYRAMDLTIFFINYFFSTQTAEATFQW